MKHLYARTKTRATILCSTNGALNLLLLGEKSPKMSKNAQKSKMGSCGNAKCSIPVGARPIKLRLSNVSKAVLQKCVRTMAASGNRSEDIADFPQKSRFLGVFRRCFSRLSPHPGQSGKSHLLSILIIYRYIHACQVSGKS